MLLSHANLPWTLLLAILARALTFSPDPVARPACYDEVAGLPDRLPESPHTPPMPASNAPFPVR